MSGEEAPAGGRLSGLLAPPAGDLAPPGASNWHWCTKHALAKVCTAMRRGFASASANDLVSVNAGAGERLVLALFERRAYFEVEARTYRALAATGALVVVGFPGEVGELPEGVHGVDLTGREALVDSWALAVAAGSFAAALVAVPDGGLLEQDGALEASRTYLARWTFRREDAVDACRQLLGPLRARLPARVLSRAEAALCSVGSAPVLPGEEQLLVALEVLSSAVELGPRRRRSARGSLEDPVSLDLLTGLANRRSLDWFVSTRARESSMRVVAMLIDVDDLGALNERRGPDAGDVALRAIAAMLRDERRSGDFAARVGDDELLVLSPLDTSDGALARAERLVAAVRALRLPPPFDAERLSVSIGSTICDPTRIPFERLEDALHLAKLLGKDAARAAE